MTYTPISICPITDVPVSNTSIIDTYYQYDIIYNQHSYTIRLALELSVGKKVSFESSVKMILQGMLHNNEWPIEKETVITNGLISQLVRFGIYPKEFDEKIEYYIVKCYLNGGKENRSFPFDVSHRLDIYAKDEDEFERLFDRLKNTDLVDYKLRGNLKIINSNHELKLVGKGIELAKKIINEKPLYNLSFQRENAPKISIISTKEDEEYAIKLNSLFRENGASTLTIPSIDKNDKFFSVPNIAELIEQDKVDYIIFIKSINSDNNNNYGSVYDQAIITLKNKTLNYLYFAFVDDSDIQSRPGLVDYNNRAIDIRIETNRKTLLSIIKQDYSRRVPKNNIQVPKKYIFQKVDITEDERKWLKAVFRENLLDENFEYRYLLSVMSRVLSKDFDPETINPLLIRGGKEITLLGIWQIEPDSTLFEKIDIVIKAIKSIISSNKSVKMITNENLKHLIQNIPINELRYIGRTLLNLGFANQYGTTASGFSIGIDTNEIYKKYLKYDGLEDFIKEYYFVSKKEITNEDSAKVNEPKINKFEETNIEAHKTQYRVRDTSDINPVMGVIELSNDLAEIIDSIPNEKGSMIGIFGKWGRGKTFLLKELWKILSNKETKYIKLEYHAWKYQETPASWAYLYELFSEEYFGKKGIKYFYRVFKLNYHRLGIIPIIKLLLAIIFFIGTSIYIPQAIETENWYILFGAYSTLSIATISIVAMIYKEFKVKAVDLIKKYNLKNSFKETLGLQANIQDELIQLLKIWLPDHEENKQAGVISINDFLPVYLAIKNEKQIIDIQALKPIWWKKSKVIKSKIILYVEDIDRCTEEKIIQNIDALRILLEDEEIAKRVIIVTAIDERILKNAIEIKYKSILKDTQEVGKVKALVSEYLDKLFISAVKLGELTLDQKSQYFTELIKQEVDKQTMVDAFQLSVSDFLKKTIIESNLPKDIEKDLIENHTNQKQKETEEKTLIPEGTQNTTVNFDDSNMEENEEILRRRNEELQKGILTAKSTFEKLTAKEVYIMDNIIKKWKGATPRKIRIFYYRYLLSKNLLIDKYLSRNNKSIWRDEEGIKVIMVLILKYSKAHDSELISKKKNAIAHSEDEDANIKIEDKIITIDRLHYLYLLEVLELVIAY